MLRYNRGDEDEDLSPAADPGRLIDLIAERFRVLGEPMRIRLMDAMYDGEATVGELQEATGA